MKKTILFFALLALSITGCESSYECIRDFNVVNQTRSDIVLTSLESEETITIKPDETQTVHRISSYCDKDAKYGDHYKNDYNLLQHTMVANGKSVSREIFKRKYWSFQSEVRHATYTLIVTESLIESVGRE